MVVYVCLYLFLYVCMVVWLFGCMVVCMERVKSVQYSTVPRYLFHHATTLCSVVILNGRTRDVTCCMMITIM